MKTERNGTERYGTTLETVTERHVNYRFTKRNGTLLETFFLRVLYIRCHVVFMVIVHDRVGGSFIPDLIS